MTIFIITLAFIAGVIWGLYLKISIIPFLALLAMILILFKLKKRELIAVFIVTCLISNLYISTLEENFENKYKDILGEVGIVGTIISSETEKQYTYQYKIRIDKLEFDGKQQKQCEGTCLLLKIKKSKRDVVYNYGDKISLYGEFELPEVQRNYGGFDYREYLKTKGLYGIVTSTNSQIKLIKVNNENIVNITINRIAKKIKENINQILSNEQASLLTGILIGDKSGISDKIQENFRDSNLSHMLAISGAHVSYIILGITFTLNKIKVGKRNTRVFTIILLVFFTILTGCTPSVERATIMAIYILIGNLLYKKPNILVSISLSMLIILIQNPYSLFDIGFQLSFGGTIGIVIFNKRIKTKESRINVFQRIKEIAVVTLSANLVIIPIMMFHYNTISLTFLLSNILASQILGVVIILGFIVVFISFIANPISMLLGKILGIFLNILILISEFSSKIPFSKIYVVTPDIMQIVVYYYAILSQSDKHLLIKKCMIVFLVVTLIFPNIHIFPGEFEMHFIDVGQGDSMLVITPCKKTILVDGGGTSDSESFDVGKNTLLPYLLDRKINKLDFIMISHFDSDHVGRFVNYYERTKSR